MAVDLKQAIANSKSGVNPALIRAEANKNTNAYTNPSYYNYNPSVASNNLTTANTNIGTKTFAEKNAERKANTPTYYSVPEVNDDSEVLNAYYEALMSRWNDATEKRNSYLNALYSDNQKDIDGRYSRLKRALMRKATNNGQDPYVTNAWNIDYAKDTSQRELDKSKLEAEATNASNDYSVYSSLYNSLLNSNASNATKKKLLGIA